LQIASFYRQLKLYGFRRISNGSYRHDLFQRDKPELFLQMKINRTSTAASRDKKYGISPEVREDTNKKSAEISKRHVGHQRTWRVMI